MLHDRLRFLWALCLALALSLCFAGSAAADGDVADANFADGKLHWNISAAQVLTISVVGDNDGVMPDYTSSVNAPWYSYRSQIGSIVVEEGVTALGSYAFYGLSNAETVSLPATLTALGASCFRDCGKLTAVTIPNGVSEIPAYAFYNCSALASVDLPDSVQAFGSDAFCRCSRLQAIEIPEGVTTLNVYELFYGCNSLTSISLPSTLKTLGSANSGSDIFTNTIISDIYFNGTLSDWLTIVFSKNLPMRQPCNLYLQGEKLTNLVIPDDVTAVPDYAFQYVNLQSVTLSYRVGSIGTNAFYGSSVASVRMYDSVTSVGTNAFANCGSLRKVFFVGDSSKWSSIAWNTGNDNLIDADRSFVTTLDGDIHSVTVGAVEHGTVTVSDAYCMPGDVITVTAQPAPGYKLGGILVNGAQISGNSFIAEADTDYVVTAEFTFYKTVTDSGACGSNLTWTLYEDGELNISGSGEMGNTYWWQGDAPWYSYRSQITSVTIDEGVTSVGRCAFYGCINATSVTLPSSLERIEESAFRNCSSLTSIALPVSLRYVGYYSFYNCPLESVCYAGGVADWLGIEFSHSGDGYGYGLPQAATSELYFNGVLVDDLVIPNGMTSVPRYAFFGYRGLKSIVFPASVTSIGAYAFSASNLTYAEFLGDAPSVGNGIFPSNDSFVIYYHIGTTGWTSPTWNGYTAAQVEAFDNYAALDEDNRSAQGILFKLNNVSMTAMVGDGSSTRNNSGYYGAQKGAIVIPDAVTKDGKTYQVIAVGPNAFSGNKNVKSVSIGTGVTSIISSAFSGCPALTAITVAEGNEFYATVDGVLYDKSQLTLYAYPGGKTDVSFTVPETVRTIDMYAFHDNEYLQTLTVGRNVTAIYHQAFCGLTNLGEITLPFIGSRERNADNSYNYYSEAFDSVFGTGIYGKNALNKNEYSYYYDDVVGRIYTDGSLKKVTITGGTLYYNAFIRCGSIEELVFSFTPTSIPNRCFGGCSALQKITFAGHTCSIGELVLPEGIQTIGENAFYGCKGITSVTLPASLTSFDSSAFAGSGLEKFVVASGNHYYSTDKWGVLYNYAKTELIQYPPCRKWPYYNVAATATAISRAAFSGCKNLVNLYIPNTVTSISRDQYGYSTGYAISDCPYLTICCYLDSAAYQYAVDNGLHQWSMDNKTLQGIRVYSLPEQTVQTVSYGASANFAGLYVVGNYQGRELQIDDYTLSYDKTTSGVKTVTVEYQGKTVAFQMVLYTGANGNVISFRYEDDMDGKTVLIAVYDSSGKMLWTGNAVITDGEATVGVSDSVYQNADYAKLFILDSETFAPAAEAQEQDVGP